MRPMTSLCFSLCFSLLTLACGDKDDGGGTNTPPVTSLGSWREVAPIEGGPRQEHGVAALDGKIYVVAGVNPANTARISVYDPQTDSWSQAAPIPMPMNHPNVAAAGGKLYVIGGMVSDLPWYAVGNVYEYDPQTNTWTELAPMPAGTERGSAAVGVSGTKIYLAGGLRSLAPDFQDTVATFSSYDVATGTWETLPDLPEPRDHVGGAVVDGTFYVLGGRANGVENVKGTVFAYDISAGTWSARAPLPTPRGGVATAVIGKKIYVIGGEGNPAPGSQGVYGDNEVYDTETNTWAVLAPMLTPRHGTGAAAVGSTVYVPGGASQTRLGPIISVEAFTP
ncbi:kelch repeat-containing protein [Archangium violaceum]|uniref:Kelch repeat-containing protein n=1 Tax=Archangium violaceum TaxID=83451 RepID=UPI002B2CA18D|nr:kelch repeat-containing protein [Archangium violaceum]